MPIIESAIKKMRKDSKRRKINHAQKEKLKVLVKTAQKEPAEKNIKAAISFVDKAAKTNLIHANKAARLKSRLSRLSTQQVLQNSTPKSKAAPKKKTRASKPKKTPSPKKAS